MGVALGEADALTARLAGIGANVSYLDAVIRLFDASFDFDTIRPERPRGPDASKPGDTSRFVLNTLQDTQIAPRASASEHWIIAVLCPR